MSDVLKFVKKVFSIGVVFSTMLWSLGVTALTPAVVQAAVSLQPGDLFKVSTGAAIYAVDSNGHYLYFPDGDVFKSWNKDEAYKPYYTTITPDDFKGMSQPAAGPFNVFYRPGSYVVNYVGEPTQLYVVQPNRVLAKITTDAAKALYGTNFVKKTIGLSEWAYYSKTGTDVTEAKPHVGMLVSNGGKTWYVADGKVLREVTATGMTANRFKMAFVHAVSDSAIAGYNVGAQVTAQEAALSNRLDLSGSPVVTGGDVTVSLAADTPASMSIAQRATGVVFTKFNVKGTNGAVTLNEVVLHRIGIGAAAGLNNVYLYAGNTRLTGGRTVASDTNKVTFTNVKLSLAAGETKTLSVVGDLSSNANSGDEDGFEVVGANGATVAGVVGNVMRVGSAQVSSVTIAESGSTGSLRLGATNAEMGKFTLNAGSATYDVKLSGLILTNSGSVSNSNLANLQLVMGGQTVATAASMTGDKAVFNFSTPVTITKGDTKTFYVYGDVTGGRVNDTISFYVDQTSDAMVVDTQYNTGANLTNNWATGDQTYTLTGGELTLASNGPAAGTIGKNVTNVTLQKMSFSASNGITVKSTRIYVALIDGSGTTLTTTTNYAFVKNVRLVDTDTKTTLVGPQSDYTTGATGARSGLYKDFTDTYDINAGQTRHLAVVADIDTNMPANYKVFTTVDYSVTNGVKYQDNSQYVSASNIVPSYVQGNQMTINGASLTVTRVTPPSNATVVMGSTAPILGLLLTPGQSDAVKVTSLKVRMFATTSAAFTTNGTGSVDANNVVNTVSVSEEGAAQPLMTKNLVDASGTPGAGGYRYVTFNNLNYVVPAGMAKKLVVTVSLKNTLNATNYVMADVVPTNDMEVETAADGKSVDHTRSSLNQAATAPVQLTVNTGSSVTAAIDTDSNPVSDVVVSGSGPATFSTYKFTASGDSAFITGFTVTTTNPADVKQVFVTYKNKAGETVTKTAFLSGNSATFNDGSLDIYLPVNQTTVITVGAYLNTINEGATAGDQVKVGLTKVSSQFGGSANLDTTFIVLGESSNTKTYGGVALVDSSVNAQTVYKTKVTAAESDSSSVVHSTRSQDAVGVFTFTSASEPGSNQKSVLGTVTVNLSGNLIAGAGNGVDTTTVYLYNGSTFDNAHLMGYGTISGLASGTSSNASIALTAQNEFSGTKQVYVVVDTTAADFSDTSNNTEKITTKLVSFTWNDGTGIAAQPVTGVPVYGKTYTY